VSRTTEPRLRSPLAGLGRVRVGTLNEPKLEAVRTALAAYAPEVSVEGVSVESGVPEQPVGYPEIVAGARNRARAALAAGDCELAVGVEDGLVELQLDDAAERAVLNVGCAVVCTAERESLGFSSAFAYPPDCVAPALDHREPIGEVFDRVFGAYAAQHEGTGPDGPGAGIPSGRTTGNIGKLSLGVLPRSDYARQAVLCALVRFLHPALYDRESPS
jgi:inosine/xanthosine triphosphatase